MCAHHPCLTDSQEEQEHERDGAKPAQEDPEVVEYFLAVRIHTCIHLTACTYECL